MIIDRRQVFRMLATGVAPLLLAGAFEPSARAQSRDLTLEAPAAGAARPRPGRGPVQPVRVSLTPIGPSVLSVGSRVRFRIQSNNAGFGHAYIVNASGKVVLLAENLPLRANRSVDLPRSGMILRATPPTGDNVVHFLATRARFPGFAGGSTTTTPIDIQSSATGLEAQLVTRLSDTPRSNWGRTSVTIRVVD